MTEAYPLRWPDGWPRTERPFRSRFDTPLPVARDALLDELRLLSAENVVLNSNMKLRQDGLPYARQGFIDDCGVAVYFTLDGEQQCIPCDRWDTVGDNVQAIRLTVAALRGLDRWGAKEMVHAAFRGFAALPDPDSSNWWDILGISHHATEQDIKSAYRKLAMRHHPDRGGSADAFKSISDAYQMAIKSRIRS